MYILLAISTLLYANLDRNETALYRKVNPFLLNLQANKETEKEVAKSTAEPIVKHPKFRQTEPVPISTTANPNLFDSLDTPQGTDSLFK